MFDRTGGDDDAFGFGALSRFRAGCRSDRVLCEREADA